MIEYIPSLLQQELYRGNLVMKIFKIESIKKLKNLIHHVKTRLFFCEEQENVKEENEENKDDAHEEKNGLITLKFQLKIFRQSLDSDC